MLEHADSALHFLAVVDLQTLHGRGQGGESDLEASGAPVDELDGPLRLDGGNGGVDVLGDDISAVQQAVKPLYLP